MVDLREQQLIREAGQRQAALGRRAAQIQGGHLGPVLKRWINADVRPIADLLRETAKAYLAGDMAGVANLLHAPTIELSQRERPLSPLMEWCLRGSSPGRVEGEDGDTTYADDIALSFMATLITRLASSDCTVSAGMTLAADAVRDTIQGQFITSIQGATAMQALRERSPDIWKQKKSLQRIAAQLASQVKPIMTTNPDSLETRGSRKVVKVVDYKGDIRRLELTRVPDAVDWAVMSLCWNPETDSSTSPHRSLWLAFTGMLLAMAQKSGGWFEVSDGKKSKRKRTATRMLVLSELAQEAIAKDVQRWVSSGFTNEPMLVPPEDGDYLTVKHKKVTGQRPPKGLITRPEESFAWLNGACALADTAWTVNPYALTTGESTDTLTAIDPADIMREAEHRRLGLDPFYLPVNMDFRGRIYYRTNWVGPQSGDLGKSLLCFPSTAPSEMSQEAKEAVIMHLAGLYGGPDKLDKAPYLRRSEWFAKVDPETFKDADKPLTLAAHWSLAEAGEADRIPIQLDGTCNGLQHLSALFRDEEAARHVNLCASTLEAAPADIYGLVARLVTQSNAQKGEWWDRLSLAGVQVGRSLCKGPVMVLPYGGTREAVRLAVKAQVLEQLDPGDSTETPWHRYEGDNYEAFRERPLGDHPLFNADIGQLSSLVWDSISPAIPRAMQAMGVLQEIGKWVGTRALSWRTGPMDGAGLWVIQAKSKAARKQVTMKGFHLPDMVRRLTLMSHSNEVDPRAHRTGIVANFIHSLDASHLSRAIATFRASGGGCVGAVHDCLLVRPSEAGLMGTALRSSFVEMYEEDPLSQPIKVIETEGSEEGVVRCFDSWYALAEAAGVEFPHRGSFDIREVKQSAWFFS